MPAAGKMSYLHARPCDLLQLSVPQGDGLYTASPLVWGRCQALRCLLQFFWIGGQLRGGGSGGLWGHWSSRPPHICPHANNEEKYTPIQHTQELVGPRYGTHKPYKVAYEKFLKQFLTTSSKGLIICGSRLGDIWQS